jgi:hypothetical protein
MLDFLTGDGGILLFATVGIVATAVSIVHDARGQKARLSEELEADPVEVRAA